MGSSEEVQPSQGTTPDIEKNIVDNDASPPNEDISLEEKPVEQLPPHMVFPEGGARAWSVALGTAGVLFCTFGYANAFGYADLLNYFPSPLLIFHSVYQEYYQTNQLRHESPSTISWLGSIQMFFLFGGNLFGGPLFDRYGAKVSLQWAPKPPFPSLMYSFARSSGPQQLPTYFQSS